MQKIVRATMEHCGRSLIYSGVSSPCTFDPQFFPDTCYFFTGRLANDPPHGHPERVTPEVPLNEVERHLEAQVADL